LRYKLYHTLNSINIRLFFQRELNEDGNEYRHSTIQFIYILHDVTSAYHFFMIQPQLVTTVLRNRR